MLRGINRQDIFEDEEDYLQMVSILRALSEYDRGTVLRKKAAEPSAVIILKKIDMDRIEIVNKYCGGGTLPKVITESPDY